MIDDTIKYKKVIAIIRCTLLEQVEKSLLNMGIKGISISQIHGYGEYHNFYKGDLMSEYARIEVFCMAKRADEIAQCVISTAHTGQSGDGIVAVLPIDTLQSIKNKGEVSYEENM